MPKIIMILIGFFIMGTSIAQATPVGKAVSVSGDVWMLLGTQKVKLSKGDTVQQHQTIITGVKGRVRLLMNDKSKVYLSPRSRLKLKKYEVKKSSLVVASFKMFWGKIRYFVHKLPSSAASFNVKTRTAVLGVRGTEFDVSIPMPAGIDAFAPNLTVEMLEAMPTSVEMLSGVVVLIDSKGGSHELTKGTSTTADAEGNVSQKPMAESSNQAATSDEDGAGSKVANQAANTAGAGTSVIQGVANTAGVGASVIQGSTITTPYEYHFDGDY